MKVNARSCTLVKVPEPQNLTAQFVYNFFTADEKVNDKGDMRVNGVPPSDLQKTSSKYVLRYEVPRYVEINFAQVNTQGLDLGDAKNQTFINAANISKINSEESITNSGFCVLRESDTNCASRLRKKIGALSKSLGVTFDDTEQSKKIAAILGIPQDQVQSLITPVFDKSKYLVNSRKDVNSESIFEKASKLKLKSQVSKRFLSIAVNSADDSSPLSNVKVIAKAEEISKAFLSQNDSSINEKDLQPILTPLSAIETGSPVGLESISSIGYLLVKRRISDDGKAKSPAAFFLPGSQSNRYVDTQVAYGSCYSYEIRTVFQIVGVLTANLQTLEGENLNERSSNYRITYLISSRPSNTATVRTEEFQPPNEPDGVLYNFNYDNERGLVIRWQIPTGSTRDTKYFQVFRRRSIFEPFSCIAQIDFDDSLVRTVLSEQVRPERIFSFKGTRTFHEDTDFTRNDKYIYAVAAIDAHGYTSGYSAQTEVGFDKVKNKITLKSISKSGAPKQYPNFYIDPKLDTNTTVDSFTQDAIFDSGHKKIRVYFTPDAKIMKSADGREEKVFYTVSDLASYHFHMINLDLQKSDTATLGIVNLQKQK